MNIIANFKNRFSCIVCYLFFDEGHFKSEFPIMISKILWLQTEPINRLKHMYCILLFWLQLVKYIYIFTDQLNSITLCLKLCIHWDLDLTEALARPSLTNPNDNFLTTVYFIIYEMTSSNNKRHKKINFIKVSNERNYTCTLVKLVRG